MNKQNIKTKLREGLLDKLREAGKNQEVPAADHKQKQRDDKASDAKRKDKRGTKKDYNDIQNYFKKDLSLSVSIVADMTIMRKSARISL